MNDDGQNRGSTSIVEESARQLSREQEARFEAEAAGRRFAFLAEAGRELSSSLDPGQMLTRLASLLAGEMADYAVVDVFDERGEIRRVAAAHRRLDRRELVLELQRRFPPRLGTRTGAALVLRTGEPILVQEMSREQLRAAVRDEEHLALMLTLGVSSYMVVPMLNQGRVLGALSMVIAEPGRPYGPDDLVLAEEIGQRAALALDNARLYQQAQDATRRLEESHSLLDALLLSAPVGISFLDRDLRYLRINAVMAELNGIDSAAAVGRSLNEVIPDLAPKVEPLYRRVLRTGEPLVGLEVSGETPAAPGERRHFLTNYYPIRSREGPPVGVGAAAVEITQRKRAEEALRESNQTLRALIESCPLAVMVLEPGDGAVRLWNPAAERIFGWTEEEVLGRPLPVIPEEERRQFFANLEAVVSGGRTVQGLEGSRLRRNGTMIEVTVWASPLASPGGTRVLAMAADNTERRRILDERQRLEEELRQRLEELAAADRTKDEFLAMLAHELRNPLAAIANAGHLLDRKGGSDPGSGEMLAMIGRQIRHLSRLVDDLLDVSRFSRGRIELRQEPVELRRAVEGAVETARPLIEQRRHRLTVALPEEPLWIEADLTRIEQILANLLHNAAKFTEPGGEISLAAEPQGSEVLLRVRDTGAGIDPGLLPRIFDLFVQEERSLARSQGGLGIGLTLVRTLVERHGGTIEAASEGPGRGSEFRVRLPLIHPPAPPERAAAAREIREAGGTPARVLLVEDNLDAAMALGELLRIWGHPVEMAHDGVAALQAAREVRPEVVLLDIGLPGMDGYEVASRLRATPGLERVRLIALTGYGQEADRRRSSLAGFDHHLVKPVDLEHLRGLLAGDG
jgi:PAS domain S-box-containing protein